ncbi:hypothetical protein HMPREF0397_1108 [Fusobacterium nucleatum subsp. nucleatum ATCC 23726]|uniref:Uncharacterized protein n=1 Tax=Fusobacterium nucleatum subsp. nucleatum (strain ATCC 23726 / VPI 4351) TaxID=525283 RepID=D5RD23_FUSN2|nr:hypothetical protein HMPREF0397_1108 [Fusobacterium nucleatum subsp. nucleatum ATCC 23726]
MLNLCISILEFKWAKSGDLKKLAKNLCISILEFKSMFSTLLGNKDRIYVFLY